MGGSIVTRCALLHSVCDLIATQMNVLCSLIWEPMHYVFKLDQNAAEVTKIICCAKNKGAIDHCTVTKWF